jgi:hypothetical protein
MWHVDELVHLSVVPFDSRPMLHLGGRQEADSTLI